MFRAWYLGQQEEMQPPIARGFPAVVSTNRLPVHNLSSPLQGSFRFHCAKDIAARAAQIDDQKRRQVSDCA
jgi:hypothetical protein